jgi:hypothetical protein
VFTALDATPEDFFTPEGPKEVAANEAFRAIDELEPWARSLAGEFLDWMRIRGAQPWLGVHGHRPDLARSPQLFEEASGRRLPIGTHRSVGLAVGDAALGPELLEQIRFLLARGEPPPIAEGFLADAKFFAGSDVPGDRARAVLLAAIATELKAKETLRLKSSPSGLGLLRVLMPANRPMRVPVAELFDSIALVCVGQSLATRDEPLLRAIRKLFTARNGIAHTGVMPDIETTKAAVHASAQSFAWLDLLPSVPEHTL